MRQELRGARARPTALLAVASLVALGAAAFGVADESEPTLKPRVRISTSLGDVVVRLNAEVAPLSTLNFLKYAEDGFYQGTIFHRVREHVIQGGAYTPDMQKKESGLREPVLNESGRGLFNARGTIAMYIDPLRANSAQAQFFINVQDNSLLDRLRYGYGYAVFGEVVKGMDVVDKIAAAETTTHPAYAAGRSEVVPETPVLIQSVTPLDRIDRLKAFRMAAEYEEREKNPVVYRVRSLETEHGKKAVETDSGLIIIDVVEGTGAFPLETETVEIEFEGYLPDSHKPFDSSAGRWNRPGKLVLKSLLPGLREAIGTMQEGGRRIAVVPPELAFGEAGMPAKVPPNTTVIYDIRLLGVSDDEPEQ